MLTNQDPWYSSRVWPRLDMYPSFLNNTESDNYFDQSMFKTLTYAKIVCALHRSLLDIEYAWFLLNKPVRIGKLD